MNPSKRHNGKIIKIHGLNNGPNHGLTVVGIYTHFLRNRLFKFTTIVFEPNKQSEELVLWRDEWEVIK